MPYDAPPAGIGADIPLPAGMQALRRRMQWPGSWRRSGQQKHTPANCLRYKRSAALWLRQLWRGLTPGGILFAVPALLLIPVLYYSLNTPYAFVDDHAAWNYVRVLDGPKELWQSLVNEVSGEISRYRPVLTYYDALTWKVYGETMWLHHLTRWLVHFGAVFVWSAAFLRFCSGRRNVATGLVPLGLLVWLWVFFPNSPASRLGPQELYTVFFLGVCTWVTALILSQERGGAETGTGPAWWQYGLLYAAYLGLGGSKEINLAVMLWILAFYYALTVRRPSRRTVLGLSPLALIFLGTLLRVYEAYSLEDYGVPTITTELIGDNAGWLLRGLFQVETSPYIFAGFALLAAILLGATVILAARRRIDARWVFIVFLLGQFAVMYLILLTSWHQVLRYWYILIPVFTTLLAFGSRFILEAAERWLPAWGGATRYAAPVVLVGFVVFFIAGNYYNFLWQTITQHSVRQAEGQVISEIVARHNDGEYIQILENYDEHFVGLSRHFSDFAPYWRGQEFQIHTAPPDDERPYYVVGWNNDPILAYPEVRIDARQNYAPLAYAYRAADLLQAGEPYRVNDAGAVPSNTYGWILYRRFENDTAQIIAESGPPLIQARYNVHHTVHTLLGDSLLYVKEECSAGDDDIAAPFLLHIVPADAEDLPEHSQPPGFENRDFTFEERGWREEERCLAWQQLPAYEIGSVRTGQYLPTGELAWEGYFRLDDPGAPAPPDDG